MSSLSSPTSSRNSWQSKNNEDDEDYNLDEGLVSGNDPISRLTQLALVAKLKSAKAEINSLKQVHKSKTEYHKSTIKSLRELVTHLKEVVARKQCQIDEFIGIGQYNKSEVQESELNNLQEHENRWPIETEQEYAAAQK